MRKALAFLTLSFLVCSAEVIAEEKAMTPGGDEPLAYFPVNNGWTGEVFLLYEKDNGHDSDNKEYTVVHEIYGAGVPVISRETYHPRKVSETKLSFRVDKLTFTIMMNEGTEPQLFLNGYQLATH